MTNTNTKDIISFAFILRVCVRTTTCEGGFPLFIELEPVFNNDGASLGIDYSFTVEDEDIATSVHVVGQVINRTGIVSLEATARFDYSAACALCCKPLVRHATVPVRHLLIAELHDEDNDSFIRIDNMRLDLDELVSEDIWLSIPSRFLCREDCKGLCANCGADLNEGECGCKKVADPRLAALEELLNK